jgi:N-acetyl-anhydromuramyl-L-alanine amidase AmpD
MKQTATLFALLLISGVARAQEESTGVIPVESVRQCAEAQVTGEWFLTVDDTKSFPEVGRYSRRRTLVVDTLVLHNISNPTAPDPYDINAVIAVMRRYEASVHYVIARDGLVYRLVSESRMAYHAGESRMPSDGREDVNRFSIGIEIINDSRDCPTEDQYEALTALVSDIKTRHAITEIVAHGEIAPNRRSDPYNFRWDLIADW